MVRVDETWQDEVPREVEHFLGRGGQVRRRADLLDEAIANKQTTIGNLPLAVIHGHDVGMCDKQRRHVDHFYRMVEVSDNASIAKNTTFHCLSSSRPARYTLTWRFHGIIKLLRWRRA